MDEPKSAAIICPPSVNLVGGSLLLTAEISTAELPDLREIVPR